MLFNSIEYIFLFLPVVVVMYFLINRIHLTNTAKIWLIIASLFFYGYWESIYLILIISSILVNFSISKALLYQRSINGGHTDKKLASKFIIFLGVSFNLGLLAYFKYADFFIANVNWIFHSHVPALNLILPLAISFFTFQQIAYLVDCYQQKAQEYDFLNYCLFVTFFPQLIAGPIVHHKEMMPQFRRIQNKQVNWQNISTGLFIFFIGLFKKVVIADSLSVIAKAGFDENRILSFFEAWETTLSYTFQIYFDFSGYTDMAIGAALLLNIKLPINFNSPYKACNIGDFWRRWHITLSRWLRDYVYIPLGGNRVKVAHVYYNVIITFFLGGLWHGADWTFVIWGLLHGSALVISRIWNQQGYKLHKVLGWFLTFSFVNFTWIFFRATSFYDVKRIIHGIIGLNGFDYSNVESFKILFLCLLLVVCLPNTVQMIRFIPYFGKLNFRQNYGYAIFTGFIAASALIFLLMSTGTEFLYFNF